MIAYEGISPRVGNRWLYYYYLRWHHEMSVQHPLLRAVLDFRQELAGLERRAIGGQNTV